MGQNYSFNTNYAELYGSTRGCLSLELITTQDIALNRSTVSWRLFTSSNWNSGNNLRSLELGYKKSENRDYTMLSSWDNSDHYFGASATIASGSFIVDHNIDGNLTLKFYCYGVIVDLSLGGNADSMSFGYSSFGIPPGVEVVLPTIPVASPVTCTTAEIGRNPTISINSPSTTFRHTLRYKFGTLSGTIATNLRGGSYDKWSIPTSFLAQITGKYGTGTIYCDTYNYAGTLNGTTETSFRVNVPSTYGPNFTATIKNIDSKTLSLTGNDPDKIVQYFNKISFSIDAFTSTGATIKSYKITCGGQSASTSSGTFTNVESNAFTISVTDSRGFTTTETIYKTLIPYIKLTAKMQLNSVDTNGSGSIAISGNMFWASFGAVENQPVISYRWKEESGSWSNWTEVVYNVINDSYYVNIEFYGLDYQKTYIYEAKAVDQLMTVTPEQLIVKCMPVFDWNNSDFQFNVPVTISGDLVVEGIVTSRNEPSAQVDFIVEQGVTDGWTWRKWESGIAECWCKKSVTTTISTAWGSLYASGALAATNLTMPITFKEVPTINVTVTNNGAGVFLMASGSWAPPSVSTTGAFELVRAVSSTASNSYGLNYSVNGRWK